MTLTERDFEFSIWRTSKMPAVQVYDFASFLTGGTTNDTARPHRMKIAAAE
jgi:hypothetical protein